MTPGRRRFDDLGVVAALAALAAAAAFSGWTWPLDRLVYDRALAAWPAVPPADVTIVAIDDASVAAIGRWPWPRAVHATLLERLAEARPRAIALDLLLSEPDPDPRQDALLARALARAGPVVLPVAWQVDGRHGATLLEPIDVLRPPVRLGAVDPTADADGILRHGFLQAGFAGQPWPNLARALLEAGGERVDPALQAAADATPPVAPGPGLRTTPGPGSRATPEAPDAAPGWQRGGRFAIRYAGPAGTVETLSYVDVLRGVVPPAALAGRYVLIGATAQGLGDRQATPVDAGGVAMHGIEVLANELASLRGGARIVELGPAAVTALTIVALGSLVAAMTRVGQRRALAGVLCAVPAAIVASAASMRLGVWLAPAPFVIAASLAYPLWSWRRLERAIAGIDRGIAALSSAARLHPGGDPIATRLALLRQAADALHASRRLLAGALAAAPTAMLVADGAQRVLLANGRAAALFDVTDAEELVGLDLARLLDELTLPEPLAWREALAALPAGTDGIASAARLGASIDLMLHVAALDAAGARRFVVTLADIGPVRRAEREREEALGFVSHDLRAPAGSIVLLADLNLQGVVATPPDQLLRQVRGLAARTLVLADAFVRSVRAASQPLERVPVALAALVEEASFEWRAAAQARGVVIEAEVDDATVTVDRLLLGRALGNLLSNAVRHGPEGGVVRVQGSVAAGRLALRVVDRGPGLAPAQLERLRAGEFGAPVGDARGVGLGLLFVQRVARRHGGRLHVIASAPGEGTTFELEVQAAPSAKE